MRFLLILLLASPAYAQVVTVSASPEVQLTPGTVDVYVTVPKHPENRALAIIWGNDEGVMGVSEMSLEGEHSPVPYYRHLERLPPGRYAVHALLLRIREGKKYVYQDVTLFAVLPL